MPPRTKRSRTSTPASSRSGSGSGLKDPTPKRRKKPLSSSARQLFTPAAAGPASDDNSPEPAPRRAHHWTELRPTRLVEHTYTDGSDDEMIAELPKGWSQVKYLSHGTFGSVISCTTAAEEDEAVKIIDCDDTIKLESAIRELHHLIFFTRDAPHPHIIALKEAWFCHERMYVTMRKFPFSLHERIDKARKGRRRGKGKLIPPCIAVPARARIAVALLRALQHLHFFGIVHRDLKPGNVVTDEDFRDIRLIDLGSLRQPPPAKESSAAYAPLTPAKECMTEGYIPPEALRGGGKQYSSEADNFSAGLILAECITGKALFEDCDETRGRVEDLQLERSRRAFVEDTLKNYDTVDEDKEIGLLTSLLAAHPAARATATQALRLLFHNNTKIMAHFDSPVVVDTEAYIPTVRTPAPAAAAAEAMGQPDVRKVAATMYREPKYDQTCADDMLGKLKGYVAEYRAYARDCKAA